MCYAFALAFFSMAWVCVREMPPELAPIGMMVTCAAMFAYVYNFAFTY